MSSNSIEYQTYQKKCWPHSLHTVTKLEILTYIVTLPLGIMHFVAPEELLGILLPGILFIILSFCWFYFGGLYFPFFSKYILFQFRTCVLLIALFSIVALDIFSFFFLKSEYRNLSPSGKLYSIIISILDDIFWVLVIVLLIQGDSVYPKPSNLTRFLLPLYATSNCIFEIYKSIYVREEYDLVLIHYDYGNITFLQLWRAAFMQIIWFLNIVTFAAFYDKNHLYCTWVNGPILRKKYLTNVQYHQFTRLFCVNITIKTDLLFATLALLYIPIICIYYLSNSLIASLFLIILVFNVLFVLFILIYFHFERSLIGLLFKQFRSGVLCAAILLLTYSVIQRIIWNVVYHKKEWSVEVVIIEICFHFAHCVAVILLIVRDGIIHQYPNWFTILLVLYALIVCGIKIFEDTFFSNILVYPSWFLLIEKESFFQICSMSALVVYKVFRDKNHLYFVLIREQLTRESIFKQLLQFKQMDENAISINGRAQSSVDMTSIHTSNSKQWGTSTRTGSLI